MFPRAIFPAPPPVAVRSPSAAFVSAKLQRRRRPRDPPKNIDLEELDTSGFAGISALKTSSTLSPAQAQLPQEAEASASAEDRIEWRSGEALSGSDVLMAMQRAAAATATRKRYGRKAKRGGGDGRGDEEGGGYDGDVRPFNIRSDWARRLDEMERALQELLRLEA